MLAYLVDLLFRAVFWIIVLVIFLSWVPNVNWQQPILKAFHDFTEMILAPFRSLIPPISGLDLSPIVALFVLSFVRVAIVRMLVMLNL